MLERGDFFFLKNILFWVSKAIKLFKNLWVSPSTLCRHIKIFLLIMYVFVGLLFLFYDSESLFFFFFFLIGNKLLTNRHRNRKWFKTFEQFFIPYTIWIARKVRIKACNIIQNFMRSLRWFGIICLVKGLRSPVASQRAAIDS